jgi:Fic family protein
MGFMHPVVRAILVHFWLAYDHPFEDGNGRTARALFDWSMRTQGYWLTEYLSISRIFRMAPANYIRAFLYTAGDARDTTYFVVYHLEVMERALREFQDYLKGKVRELRAFEESIRQDEFNYRQVALLRNAVREPLNRYTFRSHARSHGVTFQTARTDLLTLRDRRLLTMRRVGRQYQFSPAPDLADRLRSADPG